VARWALHNTAQYLNLFVVLCMPEPRTEALRRLYEIAEDQQGLFTTKQAKAAGFAENTHPYYVQAGNWIRQNVAFSAPLVLGGGAKISYDLLLYRAFRNLKPPEEH
jgi:hypothetical protein